LCDRDRHEIACRPAQSLGDGPSGALIATRVDNPQRFGHRQRSQTRAPRLGFALLAQDMLTRFANILRYNLNRHLDHTVPLASELDVVSDYLALEAVRLEDRLRVRLAIDDGAGKVRIPPMLLQMLVENALKHGIAPLPKGGELVIRAALEKDSLAIEVLNTGRLAESEPGSTQVGLKNTRERLRILYGSRASLELKNRDGGVAATVLIPRTV